MPLINKCIFCLVGAVIMLFAPLFCLAEEPLAEPQTSRILINEFQVGGLNAYDEFIELAQIGESPFIASNVTLKYFSTLGSTKSCTLAVIHGEIPAGSAILITENRFNNPEQLPVDYTYDYQTTCSFSDSVLSPTKGLLVLSYVDINNTEIIIDEVAYGTATGQFDKAATSAPSASKSMQRILDTGGYIQDTDNSLADFLINNPPTPGKIPEPEHPDDQIVDPPTDDTTDQTINPPTEDPPADNTQDPIEDPNTDNELDNPIENQTKIYLPIYLNELFIDPDDPLTDTNDEFVEIYNPNEEVVELAGYAVLVGNSFNYKYVFKDGEKIEPKAYIALTSGSTSLALANTGGAAKVVDPDGKTLDEITYSKAKTGQSWAKNSDGQWVWTIKPTQGSVNEILPEIIAIAAKKVTTVKAASVKTTKPKVTATPKTKKTVTTKYNSVKSTIDEPALIAAPTPIPNWLLAAIGILAIIYAVYEYRFEISNKIYQFKQNRSNR